MRFWEALAEIQANPSLAMQLSEWSTDVFIAVQVPDKHSKMTAPYLYVTSRYGLVPWIPTQIEMFSDKWCLIDCMGSCE
jgi:hypothetical protein